MSIKDIVKQCAQSVYSALGSGHSEAIYHAAMEVELRLYGLRYSTKSPIALKYRDHTVGWCIADLILHRESPEKDIVVELKATTYAPRSSEKAQLLGYLRALDLPTGYLISIWNFTVTEAWQMIRPWSEGSALSVTYP